MFVLQTDFATSQIHYFYVILKCFVRNEHFNASWIPTKRNVKYDENEI